MRRYISVGDIQLQTDLHVQYGEAAAPMFEVDATLQYVVGGAPVPIGGSGSLTFRVPLDGDGVTAVTLSAAIQLFPEGVPQSIRKGRRVALSGGPGLKTAKLGAPELTIGGVVQVDNIKTRVERAPGVGNQRLKLECNEEPLSNFALNVNVRRYTSAGSPFLAWASRRRRTRWRTAWRTTGRR